MAEGELAIGIHLIQPVTAPLKEGEPACDASPPCSRSRWAAAGSGDRGLPGAGHGIACDSAGLAVELADFDARSGAVMPPNDTIVCNPWPSAACIPDRHPLTDSRQCCWSWVRRRCPHQRSARGLLIDEHKAAAVIPVLVIVATRLGVPATAGSVLSFMYQVCSRCAIDPMSMYGANTPAEGAVTGTSVRTVVAVDVSGRSHAQAREEDRESRRQTIQTMKMPGLAGVSSLALTMKLSVPPVIAKPDPVCRCSCRLRTRRRCRTAVRWSRCS